MKNTQLGEGKGKHGKIVLKAMEESGAIGGIMLLVMPDGSGNTEVALPTNYVDEAPRVLRQLADDLEKEVPKMREAFAAQADNGQAEMDAAIAKAFGAPITEGASA